MWEVVSDGLDWIKVGNVELPSRAYVSAFGFKGPDQVARMRNTGVPMEILKRIGKNVTTLPDEFNPHRQVKKNYENRKKAIETGEGIDWATGEMLAYGTLVHEGNHVRLSGQDVERGTFTHRHAVLHAAAPHASR